MKKYRLFSEYCEKEIYGNNFIDALLSSVIRNRSTFDRSTQKTTPGSVLNILKVVGKESTDNSSRGVDVFERVIIQTRDLKYLPVDGVFVCDIENYG